jgi:O-antigen/teichoic acid export membrane protein
MLKQKAIKFIKLNILFQPIIMLLGLLSSIFVIRELGTIIYANIVLLNGILSSIVFLLTLGIVSTITKLWIEFEDNNERQAIILFTIIIQIFLVFLFSIIFYFNTNLLDTILGNFSNKIPTISFIIIIISIIISTISSSLLTAELDNKVTFKALFFTSIVTPIWLINVAYYKIGIEDILMGIVIINFTRSIILLIGSMKYIKNINLKNIIYLEKIIIKKYMKFYTMISFARLRIYLSSLAFLSIILNYFNMLNELAYLAIIFKITSIVANIYGIPINNVTGVMFINAFKRKDDNMMNKIYGLIIKYNTLMYSLAFVGLFYFLSEFILLVYQVNIDKYILNIFLLNMLIAPIIGVSNHITSFNEHYKVVYVSSFLSIIIFQFILWNFLEEYGLILIAYGLLMNTFIYAGIGLIYVSLKYKNIKIPFYFLKIVLISILLSLLVGYFISNYIVALLVSVILFIGTFYLFYKITDEEKKLLYEFLPKKLYKHLPNKYRG